MMHMSGCGDTLRKGVAPMTVFEAMTLMISFGVLILMLSDRKK
jgi:hypothetical protein